MHIYIAAKYEHRFILRELRDKLLSNGFHITSRWLDNEGLSINDGHYTLEEKQKFAQMDIDDLLRAQILLYYNPSEEKNSGSGGRAVEFGIALRHGMKIIICGARTNVFHWLYQINLIESLNFDEIVRLVGAIV